MFDPAKPVPLKETWLERAFVRFSYLPAFKSFLLVLILCVLSGLLLTEVYSALQITDEHQGWITYGIAVLAIALLITSFCRLVLKMFRDSLLRYVSGPDALRTMSAGGLENLCMALYEARGCKVKRRAVWGKPDGGVDLEILRDDKRGLVQCKKWTHESVGVDKVRELIGVMSAKGADFGVIVTTNDFTEPAEIEARGKVELINHSRLWEMVQECRLEGVVAQEQLRPQRIAPASASGARLVLKRKEPLVCPECGGGLVLKQKDGLFLGCKNYRTTKCGFTARVEDGRGR